MFCSPGSVILHPQEVKPPSTANESTALESHVTRARITFLSKIASENAPARLHTISTLLPEGCLLHIRCTREHGLFAPKSNTAARI